MNSSETVSMQKKKKKKEPLLQRMKEYGFFRPFYLILFGLFIFSLLIYLISRFVPAFAEFWARYPSQAIRFLLAQLTNLFPFSIAETVVFCIPVLFVMYLVFSTRSMNRDESKRNYYRWILPLISLILIIVILFLSAFGPCYFRYSLAENLNLEDSAVSAEELYQTAITVAEKIESLKKEIKVSADGDSIMPYTYEELIEHINQAYTSYCENVSYISHFYSQPKVLITSDVFTYTHISGVYTFMTGESNININYPDFVRPFTVAHEMAHQRGIAKEEEANFVAYLVCIQYDDPYIQYSAYTNMLDYLEDALYEADTELYIEFRSNYEPSIYYAEMTSFSSFFAPYSNSVASTVSGTINNTFLNSQGESEGINSYGLVVDLAVAYYKNNK